MVLKLLVPVTYNGIFFSFEGAYPYCASANLTKRDFWEYTSCAAEIKAVKEEECMATCLTSCEETEYTTITSNVKWPKKSRYKTFYDTYLADKPFAWRFESLKKPCYKHMNCSFTEFMKDIMMVEDNFAKIDISLGSSIMRRYQDNIKISSSSFMATLGGALNLWSGITVVIILEFVDWLIRIFLEKTQFMGTVQITNDTKPV